MLFNIAGKIRNQIEYDKKSGIFIVQFDMRLCCGFYLLALIDIQIFVSDSRKMKVYKKFEARLSEQTPTPTIFHVNSTCSLNLTLLLC